MTSGWIRVRGLVPPGGITMLVAVAPPGVTTLAVTPVPSRSWAMMATRASWPALEGP